MLWPWPELVLPRGKEGSEGLIPLVSDFVRQSRWQQKCRHNIPSMRDFCAFVLKEINFSRSLLKYEEVGFCRKGQHSGHVACSHQPGLLLTSLPLALPHTSGRTCDNDWGLVCQGRLRDLKKKKVYVYCSKSCASCDQPWLSQNSFIPDLRAHFTSIRGEEEHWKPFGPSWRLSAFLGSRQEY